MAKKPIAKVDVSLSSTTTVKTTGNVSTKDVYSTILGNSNFYTSDIGEYTASITGNNSDKQKSAAKAPTAPKFYITPNKYGEPTVTLLGNHLISTPETPNFRIFPATLDNHGKAIFNKLTYTTIGDNPGWIDGSDGYIYYSMPRTGNMLQSSGGIDQQGSPQGGGGGSTTHLDNSWSTPADIGAPGQFRETLDGITKTSLYFDGDSLIQSNFILGDNQPFSIKFKIFDTTPEFNLKIGDASPSDKITDLANGKASKMIIKWGTIYELHIYQDRKIELFSLGQKIGKARTIPGLVTEPNGYTQLTVYPLGNYIYVYAGVPTTEATVKKHYVSFDASATFGKLPVIFSAPIIINFECGAANFNFSTVVHPNTGIITSPLIGNGGRIDNHVFHVSFLGKYGVGRRPFPITFPDINDSSKVYAYLQNGYTIDTTFNSEGNSAYTYDLILNVPAPSVDLHAALQAAHTTISKAIDTAVTSFKNGTSTVSQMNAAVNSAVDAGGATMFASLTAGNFFGTANSTTFINGVKASYNQFFQSAANAFGGFFGVTTNADGTVGTSQSTAVQDAVNRIFGGGGTLDTVQKGLKQTADYQGIKAMQPNIYSPAVYWTQLTLIRNPDVIDLSPNPQIDNCDVMDVSVTQSVEGYKGTIVLNNKQPCESATGKGKYTYDGQNNFCGIKPITIKLGYADNTNLNTAFTGYVTARRYARSSKNESICTIELEDMSKKLKESFAVNLPFFDGWCNLAVIYYLCKEAGFADNEILLTEGTTIRSLLTGDPDTFSGGCFEGHVNEQPPDGGHTGLPGSYLHMTLPLAPFGSGESPNYNFNFGTKLWECCQRVREFSNFYLYANNLGHIIYCPPATALKTVDKKFVEVDTVGNFNEIKRRLDVSLDTAESRNAVFVTGVTFARNNDGSEVGWVPHAHTAVVKNFPKNVNDTCFAPWLRYIFLRNPKWESPALASLACQEILRRATRQRVVADFDAWGDSSLLPYNVITIDESINNETSVNNFNPYVIASHTLHASTTNYMLESSFSVESVDFAAANYEPSLANVRD